jgi:hypothetical protein
MRLFSVTDDLEQMYSQGRRRARIRRVLWVPALGAQLIAACMLFTAIWNGNSASSLPFTIVAAALFGSVIVFALVEDGHRQRQAALLRAGGGTVDTGSV